MLNWNVNSPSNIQVRAVRRADYRRKYGHRRHIFYGPALASFDILTAVHKHYSVEEGKRLSTILPLMC